MLWKGAKKGRGGSISTKAEYFNGMVHNLEVLGWIFFATSAEMRLLKITEVVVDGGWWMVAACAKRGYYHDWLERELPITCMLKLRATGPLCRSMRFL